MSNFFLQLGAEGITVLMYIVTIVAAVFAGMGLRKIKNRRTEQ